MEQEAPKYETPERSSTFIGYSKVIGFSSISGFCVGAVMKRVGTEAAYVLGATFIGLNVLSYLGYVEVNWIRMREDFETKLDADGDKKLTTSDFKIWTGKLLPLGVNVAGFAAGIWAALRYI